jgi:hypothetical protein
VDRPVSVSSPRVRPTLRAYWFVLRTPHLAVRDGQLTLVLPASLGRTRRTLLVLRVRYGLPTWALLVEYASVSGAWWLRRLATRVRRLGGQGGPDPGG